MRGIAVDTTVKTTQNVANGSAPPTAVPENDAQARFLRDVPFIEVKEPGFDYAREGCVTHDPGRTIPPWVFRQFG